MVACWRRQIHVAEICGQLEIQRLVSSPDNELISYDDDHAGIDEGDCGYHDEEDDAHHDNYDHDCGHHDIASSHFDIDKNEDSQAAHRLHLSIIVGTTIIHNGLRIVA